MNTHLAHQAASVLRPVAPKALLSLIVVGLLTLAACSDQSSITSATGSRSTAGDTEPPPATAPLAEARSSTDTDSRVALTFSDVVPDGSDGSIVVAAIQSDSKGAYTGDQCGVHGKIFWYNPDKSQSGDAVFDPDYARDRSCPDAPRKLLIEGSADGPFVNFRGIMTAANGGTIDVGMRVNGSVTTTEGVACEDLLFESALVTVHAASYKAAGRTGSWTVQSNPATGHLAQCRVWEKRSLADKGMVALPFEATINEIFVD